MTSPPTCPRCGAEARAGDDLCRRCGADLPPSIPAPPPPVLAPSRRFHFGWMLGGVLGYTMLLFLGLQLMGEGLREHAAVLGLIKTEADVLQHLGALEALAWRVLALIAVCYAAGGILLGRFAGGRPILQGTVAAALSWAGLALRAYSIAPGSGGPLIVPLLLGGLAVTLVALGGAAFGAWLRPKGT